MIKVSTVARQCISRGQEVEIIPKAETPNLMWESPSTRRLIVDPRCQHCQHEDLESLPPKQANSWWNRKPSAMFQHPSPEPATETFFLPAGLVIRALPPWPRARLGCPQTLVVWIWVQELPESMGAVSGMRDSFLKGFQVGFKSG